MKKALVLFMAVLMAFALAGVGMAEEVVAKNGMVSSAHELASKAGVEILKKGGNAIDAAVATAMALNVVEPNASGIGGGGFMTIRFAKTGEVVVLDYRETAPGSATKDLFSSEKSKTEKWSIQGGKSVGVPGWLIGMWTALEKYGTLSFGEVAQPAIRLAEEGFPVHPMQNGIIKDEFAKLVEYTDPDRLPFLENGLPLEQGKILKQPALAKTFRLIAEKGPEVFYGGPVGEAVVAAVNKAGGAMTLSDLKNYRMEVRKPVHGTYRGYHIYSVPPASSGGTHIVQLLNIMENFPVKNFGHNSARGLHVMAEAMKMVYADRGAYMADTAFVKVPLDGLASKEYAKKLAAKINLFSTMKEIPAGDPKPYQKASVPGYIGGEPQERISTSHFSVVDSTGNIVASTNTINYFFGSGVFVPDYGFMLNDEMDDFSTNPASVNAPEPGKRPLSSMSPTILLDPKERPYMTIGAAGATRIISAVAQIVMNTVDHGMKMDEAIEQLRIFNFTSGGMAGNLIYEKGIAAGTVGVLDLIGHKTEGRDKSGYHGTAQGILFDVDKGLMYGGADSRRLGVPVGY